MRNTFTLFSRYWLTSWLVFLVAGIFNSGYAQTPTTDLTTHQPTSIPSGATFEWHIGAMASSSLVTTPTAVNPGVYYGFYNYGSSCYSLPSPLRVVTNNCPASTVDLRTVVDSTLKPSGSQVSFHSGLPVSSANRMTATQYSAVDIEGTYFVAYYDATTACYSQASPIVMVLSTCCPTITNVAANNVNPSSCGGSNGSIKLCGLVANGTGYTVSYSKNGTPAAAVTNQTADGSGCLSMTGLGAGVYSNIKVSQAVSCTVGSNVLSATLVDPSVPAAPSGLAASSGTACTGSSVTLTASGVSGASYTWSVSPAGATLGTQNGSVSGTSVTNSVQASTPGTYTISVSQSISGCNSPSASIIVTIHGLTNAPVPGSTSASNICPATSVNLTSLQPTTVSGQIYEWHSVSINPTVSTQLNTPATASAGTYYLYYKSSLGGCYSPGSFGVLVNITSCSGACNAGSNAPVLIIQP